jgi:hypothetical protein
MTKSKRGSDGTLFSISGASEVLSRSRRTITRALKNIRPDEIRSGLALWDLKTIISAIDRNTAAPINDPRSMANEVIVLAAEATSAFGRYDEAYGAMLKLKTVAARRNAAHALQPLVKEAIELMQERDTADDLHPEHVELRSMNVFRLIRVSNIRATGRRARRRPALTRRVTRMKRPRDTHASGIHLSYPSITPVNANVRRQPSMRLRERDAPTGIVNSHYLAIEKDAWLVRLQAFHVALELMII